MSNFVKCFQNIKGGPSYIIWRITIKKFLDFVRNWQELSNTQIACNEARLTLSEELYKIIEEGIKYKAFKNYTKNREKADRSITFNLAFRVSFAYCNYIAFFQSSGNAPSSSIDRNIRFNGIAIVLSHSLIMLIDILSHLWASFALSFFYCWNNVIFIYLKII